jgi:hypothetical protein
MMGSRHFNHVINQSSPVEPVVTHIVVRLCRLNALVHCVTLTRLPVVQQHIWT